MLNEPCTLGEFLIFPESNEIRKDVEVYHIEPKMMAVLSVLLEASGKTVSREELFMHAWENQVVSDGVLTRCISELRKIFRTGNEERQYIKTIPKKGYKLVIEPGPIEEIEITSFKPQSRSSQSNFLFISVGILLVILALFFSDILKENENDLNTFFSEQVYIPLNIPGTGNKTDVSIHPDGKQFAFIYAKNNSWSIYLSTFEQPSEASEIITSQFPLKSLAWDNSGNKIAYIYSQANQTEIAVFELDKKKKEVLLTLPSHQVNDLDWSPDGEWLAFSMRTSPSEFYTTYLVSLKNNEMIPLPADGSEKDFRYPAFSPDGKLVALKKSAGEGVHNIHIVDLSNFETVNQNQFNAPIVGLDWGNDNNTIFFSGSIFGSLSLWKYQIDQKKTSLVKQGGQFVKPEYSAGKNLIAFENWLFDSNIYTFSVSDTVSIIPTINSGKNEYFPSISSDGKQLAYVSSASGFPAIWISNTDGSEPRQLTHLKANYISSPRWSPDDKSLVFSASLEKSSDIYQVDLLTEEVTPVFNNQKELMSPSWSPDGKWIFFSSLDTEWAFWRIRKNSDQPERIKIKGGMQITPALNGKNFITVSGEKNGIEIAIRDEDMAILKRIPVSGYNINNWTVSGKYLYYLKFDSELHQILKYDLETGQEVLEATLPNHGNIYGLSFSSNTQLFHIGILDRNYSELMMMKGS